ncbi:2-oxoacid ferredoxin oxidoreductase [Thalassovita gelatinovora]|uniref:2-oxoacid ferredoxin oxidoreductase n=1 Tax=Thalassovita gelatinovora TaxID=53501 RepID=A0A0P1F8P4_THAGE|nr:indolepyruvate ferredoxin oxidoreductase family protein [Thalassovita gelatinovora]QIZ81339.1 indolepyruvate ferredoxin oxidoreductase family protein [Thalassovita gelatinovora]CUH64480.1 2-oxoacid ferredoxin oxidoreductase [Thalassovita gelatinovora]SEP97859.1 indolepyruvate ferredoxin oxidoreductase [Thalassovita gelatinovora]
MTQSIHKFDTYQLSDRYDRDTGRVFLTGTQALVRVLFDQARRDRDAGHDTAGFVSGYRGSPLGGLDLEMWRSRDKLKQDRIEFLPAVNEDLGATAVLGAQQASLNPSCDVDGVFSMWYGKGPGVDRSGDALKHGNAYGSAPKGGVLVVAGDDHGCVSSSMPHQSDVAFMAWFMPTLAPASVAEYLAFGEYGYALSRFSGTWVGFKAISETVESGQSVELQPDRAFVQPEFTAPPGGLHVRTADLPSPEIETRLAHKLAAVEAFVEANPIDRHIYDIPDAKFGIVTAGKAHLDLMEALRLLDIDEDKCRVLGIDIYKVGMVWPLARRDALAFVRGKKEVLVVEEKRGIIESQFKEYFYDWPGDKPEKMVGKHRAAGDPLIPWTGELSPLKLVGIVAERLDRFFPEEGFVERARALTEVKPPLLQVPGAVRTPYFCSGCPHNTSTKVPEGSIAASGIGCHVMASWMDRNTVGYAQMGGEGVPWVAASKFTGNGHIFQNLGEGTWYHSGSLAIRQAVAAGTNITYKILYNDAVAMTGGQPVDGPVSVQGIAQTCRAEGVERIALASDDIGKFDHADFPPGTTFHPREDMDRLQRELRDIKGTSVLIYEQTCATEKRRRRKRGTMADPKRFAFINDLVCEGCGDCSVESNCLSVEPKETEFGRKRKINLSSCNKDFSCLNGFCPSFVTLEGAERRKRKPVDLNIADHLRDLPQPTLPDLGTPFDLLVAGVGGTGVVTVGALITMAAHIEGKGASVLDFTGFAQKFGTVIGYVRLGATPDTIHQVRIEEGSADALIGCDAVVASSPKASVHYRHGTRAVLNLAEMPTGDLVLHRDAQLKVDERDALLRATVGSENVLAMDANQMSEQLMGDSVFANIILLGAAWQQGLVPVSELAMKQAILLNGVAVEKNAMAFDLGRIYAAQPALLTQLMQQDEEVAEGLAALIARRADFLRDYQDAGYAARYTARIEALRAHLPDDLVEQAARSLFKLMAFKDEYEVARLMTLPDFDAQLDREFEGDYKVAYHFAPPLLPSAQDARGRPVKRQFGPWLKPALKTLARMKRLRGTAFDPFGRSHDRRLDRDLLNWFETVLDRTPGVYSEDTRHRLNEVLAAPMDIRGYGPVREQSAQEVQRKVAQIGLF